MGDYFKISRSINGPQLKKSLQVFFFFFNIKAGTQSSRLKSSILHIPERKFLKNHFCGKIQDKEASKGLDACNFDSEDRQETVASLNLLHGSTKI